MQQKKENTKILKDSENGRKLGGREENSVGSKKAEGKLKMRDPSKKWGNLNSNLSEKIKQNSEIGKDIYCKLTQELIFEDQLEMGTSLPGLRQDEVGRVTTMRKKGQTDTEPSPARPCTIRELEVG